MSLLPELYQIIVSYTVTLKDILQLRLVCKSWCTYTTKIKTIRIDHNIETQTMKSLFRYVEHIIGIGSIKGYSIPNNLRTGTIKIGDWKPTVSWIIERLLKSSVDELVFEHQNTAGLIIDDKSMHIMPSGINEDTIKQLMDAYVKTMKTPFNLSLPEAMFDIPLKHVSNLHIETMTNEDYRQYKDLVVAGKLKSIIGNVEGASLVRVSYPYSSESEDSYGSDVESDSEED